MKSTKLLRWFCRYVWWLIVSCRIFSWNYHFGKQRDVLLRRVEFDLKWTDFSSVSEKFIFFFYYPEPMPWNLVRNHFYLCLHHAQLWPLKKQVYSRRGPWSVLFCRQVSPGRTKSRILLPVHTVSAPNSARRKWCRTGPETTSEASIRGSIHYLYRWSSRVNLWGNQNRWRLYMKYKCDFRFDCL